MGLRRLKVWPWMLDSWIQTLGPHAEAFDLELWLHDIDGRDTKVVVDSWAYLNAEFTREVTRRKLAVDPAADALEAVIAEAREILSYGDAILKGDR